MWIEDVNRKRFLEIYQSEGTNKAREFRERELLLPRYLNEEIRLIWRDNPHKGNILPVAIVLDKEHPHEFFAWVNTYLPALRPLSAYCRVLSDGTLLRLMANSTSPTLDDNQEACIGLILAETATYLDASRTFGGVSLNAFAGTYSFAMARALATNQIKENFDSITSAWVLARDLTRQPQTILPKDKLWRPWAALVSVAFGMGEIPVSMGIELSPAILNACASIRHGEDISRSVWTEMLPDALEFDEVERLMSGPREERVTVFERLVATLLQNQGKESEYTEFVCGYLLSLISPGILEHTHLLAPWLEHLPAALLWYGLCSGLHRGAKISRQFGGLGRRVLRDLLRSETLLDLPICDIAISELEVLARAPEMLEFRKTNHSHPIAGKRNGLEKPVCPATRQG